MDKKRIEQYIDRYPLLYSDGKCILRIVVKTTPDDNNIVNCEIKSVLRNDNGYIKKHLYNKDKHTYDCNIKYIKEPEISTLDCKHLTNKRMDGNTTRQVDFAIDCLYKGYLIKVLDRSPSMF